MGNIIEVDEREQRLPKWAQEKLTDARRRVRDANELAQAARLATKPDETDTLIDPWGDSIGLPKGERVRFLLADDDNLREWVDVRVKDGVLELMGGGSLVLRPQVTNVVHIKVTSAFA